MTNYKDKGEVLGPIVDFTYWEKEIVASLTHSLPLEIMENSTLDKFETLIAREPQVKNLSTCVSLERLLNILSSMS